MQRERRSTPHPFGAETTLAIVVAIVLAMVWAVHLARAIANLLAGAGWQMPSVNESITSLFAVLGGDAAAGLSPAPSAQDLAGGAALTFWIIAIEVLVVALTSLVGYRVWNRWGPGRVLGMATAEEAEQLLGLSRLRRNAPIIRPDLHPRKRRPR